jgi:hypothetical protein
MFDFSHDGNTLASSDSDSSASGDQSMSISNSSSLRCDPPQPCGGLAFEFETGSDDVPIDEMRRNSDTDSKHGVSMRKVRMPKKRGQVKFCVTVFMTVNLANFYC